MDAAQLLRENLNLKQRLDEEEANYRRKIDTYRLAQQHQATLVSRLQTKVISFEYSLIKRNIFKFQGNSLNCSV